MYFPNLISSMNSTRRRRGWEIGYFPKNWLKIAKINNSPSHCPIVFNFYRSAWNADAV